MPIISALPAIPTYAGALAALRRLSRSEPKHQTTDALMVTLGGNGNADFLEPGLRVALSKQGIGCVLRTTPFDTWPRAMMEGRAATDWWLIWLSSLAASQGGTVRPDMDATIVEAACRAAVERREKIILILPEALELEGDPFSPFVAWRRRWRQALFDAIPIDVVVLDPEHQQREQSMARWRAGRYPACLGRRRRYRRVPQARHSGHHRRSR